MNPLLDLSFYCLVLSIINFILIIYLWFFKKQKYYKIKEPNENFSLGSNSKLSNELQELKSTINKLKDKVESSSIEKINEKIKQLEIQLENIEKNSQQKLNENMINTKKEEVKKEYKEPKLIKKYAFIPSDNKVFKIENLKEQIDKRTFFVIEYKENANNAEFYVYPDVDFKFMFDYWDQFVTVVDEQNNKKYFTNTIKTVENGKLIKENNTWKVQQKLKIEYA